MADAWDGRPQNPERDGWHWVMVAHGIGHPFPMMWGADGAMWDAGDAGWVLAEDLASRWRYLGPCLTPQEVAAREAAAAEAMRAACEAHVRRYPIDCEMRPYTAMEVVNRDIALADEIAALPLPAPDALARLLDQAKREEREWCEAAIKKLREDAETSMDYSQSASGFLLGISRAQASIRARGKEPNNG